MRVRQDWLVVGIIAGVLLGVAVTVSVRMGRSNQRAMVLALRDGFERAYDEAVSRLPTNDLERRVSSELVRTVILDPARRSQPIVPGVVSPGNVFIPKEGATVPSQDLLCAVRLGSGQMYGIACDRTWRRVSNQEFARWPHQVLLAPTNFMGTGPNGAMQPD